MADVVGIDIQRGQALTPDKSGALVGQVQQELLAVNTSLQQNSYPVGVANIINDSAKNLQDSLNNLLSKKGIITPDETSSVLDSIDASKKARLADNYDTSIKNTTLYIGIAVVAIAAFFIIKKYRK
jgi:hypothetical protein